MMKISNLKTYTELLSIKDFEGRFNYLKLGGKVGGETFGSHRYLNQRLYRSSWWREIRDQVLIRDDAMEMGLAGYPIRGPIVVHHINPISIDDFLERSEKVSNLDFLISLSPLLHKAIHYGDFPLGIIRPVVRYPSDTVPWKLKEEHG